jgi:magnesium chelatase family protein
MLVESYSPLPYLVLMLRSRIEVNGGRGDPNIVLVGLPDAAVKESKESRHDCHRQQRLSVARGRMTINLAPANVKKETKFDLPSRWASSLVAQEATISRCTEFVWSANWL